MKKFFKPLLPLAIVLLFVLNTFAQYTPPTLALGLSGLTGSKGTIDVELLSSIITDKQDELKKEIIKRYIINSVGEKSYTLWEFSYNSLTMLLNSQDEKAIQRKLLENAANLALVYGFSEAYLQASAKLGNEDLRKFILSIPSTMISDNVKEAWKNVGKLNPEVFKNANFNYMYLPAFKSDESPYEKKCCLKKDSAAIEFNVLFIDMMYDIIKSQGVLDDLGFMNVSSTDDIQNYSERNKYLSYKNSLKDSGNNAQIKTNLAALYKRTSVEIKLLTENYLLAKRLLEYDLSLVDLTTALNNYDATNLGTNISFVLEKFKSLRTDSIYQLPNEFIGAVDYLNELNLKINQNKNKVSNTDLYAYHEKIKPEILKRIPSAATELENVEMILLKQLAGAVHNQIQNSTFKHVDSIQLKDYGEFILLLTNLHNLDKVETYEYILKLIRNAGDVFQDRKMAKYINLVTDNLEKYTIYDKEQNLINLKVDDIILQLSDYFSRNRKNKFAVYFSVGLNQSASIMYKSGYELPADSNNTLSNISFASEKLGFKYSLIQFNNDVTYSKKGKGVYKYMRENPFITDVHLMAYGSGLLYNVVNAKTNSNFNYILVGYGLGVSFFNSMDLNITTNIPLVSHEPFSFTRRNIITVSFDIKIGEYINAYRKQQLKKNSQSGT